MKIAINYLLEPISIEAGETACLCIENQKLFRKIVQELHMQIAGQEGSIVFSVGDSLVKPQKAILMLEKFAPFEINTKEIINKISLALEKEAMNEEHYLQTMELLSQIERYFDTISDMNYNIKLSRLDFNSLIKAVSPMLIDDYDNPLEAILDYMDYITEFLGAKLFVTVNLRSFFADEELGSMVETIKAKGFKLLLIESIERSRISGVNTTLIDSDLCQI